VFNGSERSQVEMRLGGEWLQMQQSREVDPQYQAVFDAEEAILNDSPLWRKLSKPVPSSHLWKSTLPPAVPVGTHLLQVRATDRHGREYTSQRVLRIVE